MNVKNITTSSKGLIHKFVDCYYNVVNTVLLRCFNSLLQKVQEAARGVEGSRGEEEARRVQPEPHQGQALQQGTLHYCS